MLFKPDIERVKKWYDAFWNQESLERPLLILQSYKDGEEQYRKTPVDPVRQWTDIDYIIEDREGFFKSRYFAAEAVPYVLPGIQTGSLSAFLGCEIEFTDGQCYLKPVTRQESYRLSFDPGKSKWWKFTKELTSSLVEAGKDKYFVSLPDFQGGIDGLGSIYGFSQLCMDLYSYPQEIKKALDYVFEYVYKPTFSQIRDILTRHTDITATWMGMISDKRHDVLQDDILALVSPKMAEEFVIPIVKKEATYLGRSMYHLDGPKAVNKLDLLLDIQELDGIQWVPGAGAPTTAHWLPMLKRIQKKGKVLYICSPPEKMKELVSELEPKGLIIDVTCDAAERPIVFKNKRETDDFIHQVEKWCRYKR